MKGPINAVGELEVLLVAELVTRAEKRCTAHFGGVLRTTTTTMHYTTTETYPGVTLD